MAFGANKIKLLAWKTLLSSHGVEQDKLPQDKGRKGQYIEGLIRHRWQQSRTGLKITLAGKHTIAGILHKGSKTRWRGKYKIKQEVQGQM